MKGVADSLARVGAPGAAIRAADPELFREVEAAPRSAWLPVALNVRWVEAVEHALGWRDGLDFLAARLSDQFDHPLFRSFVQGGVRLFGLDPGSLVRMIPRGLTIVFRDCGEWTAVRTGETSIELRGASLPKPLAEHAHWIESVGAGALAMFQLCGSAGVARLAEHRPAEGRAVVEARWSGEARLISG